MEDYENEISQIIDKLKKEYNNLILLNPYLLKVLANKKISKIKVSYLNQEDFVTIKPEQAYKEFKRYDIFRMLLLFILGFLCCSTIVSVIYYCKTSPDINLMNIEGNWEAILNSIMSWVMPTIAFFMTVFLSIWSQYLKNIATQNLFFNSSLGLAVCLALALLVPVFTDKPKLLLFICPLLGYFVMFVSLFLIYRPLSSRKLNDTIIESTKQLQNVLASLNASSVQYSHSEVLNQIRKVSDSVTAKSTDELIKIQSLSVLDSLRLELIQNSINGINLVEDWKYLDLSQRMIDNIISCVNKRITILGDFSFLSTEKGLDELVKAIQEKEKSFDIYFTGEPKDDQSPLTIVSKPYETFVKRIKQKYSNNEQIKQLIVNNVHLHPILSKSFTGIGFIGLKSNDSNTINVVYDKVYAYISSHLISNEDPDITRANPFVFCWDSQQAYYFKDYIHSINETDNNLSVWIDRKKRSKEDLLSIETLTERRRRR